MEIRPGFRGVRLLMILSGCGLSLNVLLLYWKLSDPSAAIAGCGRGGGCRDVLASLWSQVFGLPLPVLGILVYAVLAAALFRGMRLIAAFCYGAIFGSAVWLVGVQAVLLHRFCPWCMVAHGVGILIVVLAWTRNPRGKNFHQGLLGFVAAFGLALLQLYRPVPATHRIDGET